MSHRVIACKGVSCRGVQSDSQKNLFYISGPSGVQLLEVVESKETQIFIRWTVDDHTLLDNMLVGKEINALTW